MTKKNLTQNVLLIILIIFLSGCSYSGGPTLQKCADVCDDLIAYYPFFGNANDESGNNNHGELHNISFVEDRDGNPRRGAYFNGKSYVKLPRLSNIKQKKQLRSYTLALIFKADSIPKETSKWPHFVLIRPENRWPPNLQYHSNRDLNFEGSGSSGFYGKIIGGQLNTDVFYHVVGIVDLENSNIRIYVNGTLKNKKSWKNVDTSAASKAFWNEKILIGIGEPREDVKPRALIGVIDEVRIYNRALTDAEVETIFKGSPE